MTGLPEPAEQMRMTELARRTFEAAEAEQRQRPGLVPMLAYLKVSLTHDDEAVRRYASRVGNILSDAYIGLMINRPSAAFIVTGV